jgi:hypothetical protein
MIVRGLRLPDFEYPPDAGTLLDSYLASTDDTLGDLLHCGARWAEKFGEHQRSMGVFAGVRALADPKVSPSLHLSAISFAYLLYHWNFTNEAFQTLESIDAFLAEDGASDELPSEDPFYVAGLMCSHGRWRRECDLDDAIVWFRRSLDRGQGLQYHGPVLGAIAICLHQQHKTAAAVSGYQAALERLRLEFDREITDEEPIFDEELQKQISIFEAQRRRVTEGKEPNAVMTCYGWAMFSTGAYKYWAPVGDSMA